MLLSDDISFRDLPAYNGRTHSASVTAAWLCSKRVYVLDSRAGSTEFSLTEYTWRFMKGTLGQWRRWTIEQVRSYMTFTTTILHQ